MKFVKTVMAVLGVLFGISIAVQGVTQLMSDLDNGANMGAILGSLLLVAIAAMITLIGIKYLYQSYFLKKVKPESQSAD